MADGNNDLSIWTSLVEANFLADAKNYQGKCPTCNSCKDCNNYYCLACKQGGLCPATFRGDGQHKQHSWLQVRRLSRQSAVNPEELAKYIDPARVKLIQSISQNSASLCYLRTKSSDVHRSSAERLTIQAITGTSTSTLKRCGACQVVIPNSQGCQQDILLCCLQCLITLAEQHPQRNLLALREGPLASTTEVYPLTAFEKISSKRTARSKATSKAPIASSSSSSGPSPASNVTDTLESSSPSAQNNLHVHPVLGNNAPTRPDSSAFPSGNEGAGINRLIAAATALGDWDRLLGESGR